MEPDLASAPNRAIAVDFGARRVGIAVTDELGSLAHTRPYLDGRDLPRLIAQLKAMAKAEGISTFVIGLPKAMDGSEGIAAVRVRRLGALLAERSGATVEYVDERLTSVQASQRLRERGMDSRTMKQHVDGASAAIILQCWLDSKR